MTVNVKKHFKNTDSDKCIVARNKDITMLGRSP